MANIIGNPDGKINNKEKNYGSVIASEDDEKPDQNLKSIKSVSKNPATDSSSSPPASSDSSSSLPVSASASSTDSSSSPPASTSASSTDSSSSPPASASASSTDSSSSTPASTDSSSSPSASTDSTTNPPNPEGSVDSNLNVEEDMIFSIEGIIKKEDLTMQKIIISGKDNNNNDIHENYNINNDGSIKPDEANKTGFLNYINEKSINIIPSRNSISTSSSTSSSINATSSPTDENYSPTDDNPLNKINNFTTAKSYYDKLTDKSIIDQEYENGIQNNDNLNALRINEEIRKKNINEKNKYPLYLLLKSIDKNNEESQALEIKDDILTNVEDLKKIGNKFIFYKPKNNLLKGGRTKKNKKRNTKKRKIYRNKTKRH